MLDSFSERHGLAPPRTLIRDELPVSFRMALLELPYQNLFSYSDLQTIICYVFQQYRNHLPPQFQCQETIQKGAWNLVLEVIEDMATLLSRKTTFPYTDHLEPFVREVNRALFEHNVGWQLVNGKIVTRGDEAFENMLNVATKVLIGDKPTAAGHLRFALEALSARPKANTSGAVSHATSAVECVLGDITGQTMTLGSYLDKHSTLFHPALKKSLNGIYGYASDAGARHGKEGAEPTAEDAEFVLATCAAVCTLLTRKNLK